MQLYLRPFFNLLRQQNIFAWTTEHQTRFEKIKKMSYRTNLKHNSRSQSTILCNVRYFKFWHRYSITTISQWNKYKNLISANSCLFLQAELRISSLMRECTAIRYTLTECEFLILGSNHPTVLSRDHKHIIFLFS